VPVREFAKRSVDEFFAITVRRQVNLLLEPQRHRHDAGKVDFKPCSAARPQIAVVRNHSKSRPLPMQQDEVLGVFMKSENSFLRCRDSLFEQEAHDEWLYLRIEWRA